MSQYGTLVATEATNFDSVCYEHRGLYKGGGLHVASIGVLSPLWQKQGSVGPIDRELGWNEWKHFWGAAKRTTCMVARDAIKINELSISGLNVIYAFIYQIPRSGHIENHLQIDFKLEFDYQN